jgi:hypothetical protein
VALVNWREIRARFTHIDAEFVHARFNLPGGEVSYAVRFYPWWEHPQYRAARQANEHWEFSDTEDGRVVVTVYPRNVHEFHISPDPEVIDWYFTDEHPLLWRYYDSYQILCTSTIADDQLTALLSMIHAEAGYYLARYPQLPRDSPDLRAWAKMGVFSLGVFPAPLYLKVVDYLAAIGVTRFGDFRPTLPEGGIPAVLVIEGEDFIIADDFELDFPEVEHKPEWFKVEEQQ